MRKRILFVAEAVTLAHVARPAALVDSIDESRYDAYIACDPRSHALLAVPAERTLSVASIPGQLFAHRLRHGQPVYDRPTLQRYVDADLELIRRIRPDLVVGDFRLSLSVSARVAGVPYATITNAYWSPYARDKSVPLPVLSWTRYVPLRATQRAFDLIWPVITAAHCRPLNQVRVQRGLPALDPDLRRTYTDADHVLYADVPDLYPVESAPATHRYLGPILWSPPTELPTWWSDVPQDKPIIYATLGSSGASQTLVAVLDALADMDVSVIASTAGGPSPSRRPRNAWIAPYLPGLAAASRAQLVICNGGSPTSQQAIEAGVPVVGICGNADQLLNMRGLVAAGAGLMLRVDRMSARRVRDLVENALRSPAARSAARSASLRSRALQYKETFADFLGQVLGS